MNTLLGRKVGMTRIFTEDGDAIPVTVIQAGPCPVVQIKTDKKEKYNAVQIGYDEMRDTLINRPKRGHFKRAGVKPVRHLKEVRVDSTEEIKPGQKFTVEMFTLGERVDISGVSKGLGFQGGVRRHGFGGGPKTHGQSDRWRAPGSIGQSSYPSRVFKGTRMPGRTGGDTITVKNLQVVMIDPDNNLICVRGAVPGKPRNLLRIRKHG